MTVGRKWLQALGNQTHAFAGTDPGKLDVSAFWDDLRSRVLTDGVESCVARGSKVLGLRVPRQCLSELESFVEWAKAEELEVRVSQSDPQSELGLTIWPVPQS